MNHNADSNQLNDAEDGPQLSQSTFSRSPSLQQSCSSLDGDMFWRALDQTREFPISHTPYSTTDSEPGADWLSKYEFFFEGALSDFI